ncbi:DUF6308 family protein [Geodermatophilus nigrescens]|uniref:Uncharacterized protein n=1 Tax=Geodermatophilus nigrescens TaxID=1070870 RepID=A0A1M5JRJ1_9ACTN|nr:DUF6308 family protein [Geodermatophilus nigrescens]SHG43177.1 hypothetical protein SAMN05444351_2623 [Geodermatophilus nigrescens]
MPVDLLPLVDDPHAVEDLRRHDAPFYPGRRFAFLGARDPVRVTADDLVAVGLVGVTLPGDVALDLLEGDLGLDVADCLAQVPDDVPVGDPRAPGLLGTASSLGLARDLLEERAGLRAAGTLLARKRPLLVPVPDPVVWCALDVTGDGWDWALDAFADDDLVDRVTAVRRAAGLVTTGDLRALQDLVWMRHHREHLRVRCAGLRLPAA